MKTKIVTVAAFIAVIFTLSCFKTKSDRPNIILIMCDDLGYSDVGFNGATDIKTPNIDQLAQNGSTFSSAYVAHPFCGPSRAALMTGRYPHAFGSQFNIPSNGDSEEQGIPLNETFFSEVLQKAGYHTGAIGKWHLGAHANFHPNKRGFDEFYGFLGGGHKYFPEDYKAAFKRQKENGTKQVWDYVQPLQYNGQEVSSDEYLTDELSHAAINFTSKSAKTKKPFFLYLAYNAPHVPLEAKAEDLKLFAGIKDKDRQTYAAMVYAVDRGIGELVNSLKANGQLDNTLIIFMSDNGGNLLHGATNKPLAGSKGDTYEGGYRVPMLFHWPKKIAAGSTYKYPVSAIDLYPMFTHLADTKIPKTKTVDGLNIWPAFAKGQDCRPNETIFAMRHRDGFSDVGVRKAQWKALKVKQTAWQLFNIDEDIAEKNDLSKVHPEVLQNMIKSAENWSKTHTEPRWFDPVQLQQTWVDKNMAQFPNTFEVRK